MTGDPLGDIEQLNSFLRGELSAVETYDQCIAALEDPRLVPPLEALRHSHEQRVSWLSDRIDALGGRPARASGPWGELARTVEGGATELGARTAMAVLEQGEAHGQADYERDASHLTPTSRRFILRQVLPEQRWTRESLREIRRHNS